MAFLRADIAQVQSQHLIVDTDTGKVAPFPSATSRDAGWARLQQVGRLGAEILWADSPIVQLADYSPLQAAVDRLQAALSNFDVVDSDDLTAMQIRCDLCEGEDEILADIETDDNMSALMFMVIHHWINRHERPENLSWSEVAERDAKGYCPASPDYDQPHISEDGKTCDECGAAIEGETSD